MEGGSGKAKIKRKNQKEEARKNRSEGGSGKEKVEGKCGNEDVRTNRS